MQTSELHYWLALLRAPGIGSAKFLAILENFPTLEEFFKLPISIHQELGLASILKQIDWRGVERDLAWVAAASHHHIIGLQDDRYPPLLKEIAAPPPLLFVKGNPEILSQPQLAIVGSRNPTMTGIEIAEEFAGNLVLAGMTITSGLAIGIDAAGHRGALAQGNKTTIAVMGTDIEQIYPAKNKPLAAAILEQQGALVTEFPLGTSPRPENFPRRNRIVCGLSLGVLVVEATLRSGSLITARLAGEQGREIFAIPGSIHNSRAQGCHALIKQGAKLVETAADIIEELQLPNIKAEPVSQKRAADSPLDEEHLKLLECIGYEPTVVDIVVKRSGLAVSAVTTMLLRLEMQDYIVSVPGSGYIRTR